MVWVEVYCLVEMVPTGLILGLRPANGRRRYKVTPSLIGLAQTSNQPYSNIFAVSGLPMPLRDQNSLQCRHMGVMAYRLFVACSG